MHDSVLNWVAQQVEAHALRDRRALDVGALDVNGTVRHLFGSDYTATDMRPGKNVKVVVNAHDLVAEFGAEEFDVVVCCEMLEHDDAFWVSMQQMGAVLRPGGHLLLTTRGIGFPHHEHPHDLWRFTEQAGDILLALAGLTGRVEPDPHRDGIFLHGVKNAV